MRPQGCERSCRALLQKPPPRSCPLHIQLSSCQLRQYAEAGGTDGKFLEEAPCVSLNWLSDAEVARERRLWTSKRPVGNAPTMSDLVASERPQDGRCRQTLVIAPCSVRKCSRTTVLVSSTW